MSDNIIELSSDEGTENNCSLDKNNYDTDSTIDTDIDSLLNKYKDIKDDNKPKFMESISPSSSDDDIDDIQTVMLKLRQKYNDNSNENKQNFNFETHYNIDISNENEEPLLKKPKNENDNINDGKKQLVKEKIDVLCSPNSSDNESNNIQWVKEKIQQKYNNYAYENLNDYDGLYDTGDIQVNKDLEIEKPKPKKIDQIQKKLEKEQEKARKDAERERIKAEAAKTKAEKQQLASIYKNIKPEECIKFITAVIDSELLSLECSTDVLNTLQISNITYKITSNLIPCTVVWTRKIQAQLSNVNGQLQLNKNEENCEQVLLIMLWKDVINAVHKNKLTTIIKVKQSLLSNKKIYLGIYGLENYFRFHKSQKQKIPAKEKIYLDTPKISKKDLDMALVEIQLLFNISHRFLETSQDLSAIVLQFSKSIAQIPYKLQKELKMQKMEWYISGDNKDCVRVDKNGNGLHRLWQQQLTQFTLVRLEIAEAISSVYPSPSSLMKAYSQCTTIDEGEKLLQDIPIRRAAGPMTSVRKIGPELSKKIHTLFTSVDGNVYL